MAVITMGGLTGCGGRQLGQMVADRLEADYVDRLILTGAAKEVGATVEALLEREERPPTRGERISRLIQRILERSAVSGAGGDPYFGPGAVAFLTQEYEDLPQPTITKGHEVEDEAYLEGLRNVLNDVASSDNVVIVGRSGSAILKADPRVLRIGVYAEYEDRLARIMERDGIGTSEAADVITDRDLAREYHFKRFFGMDNPEDVRQFHICINTSVIGLEYAAGLVVRAAEGLTSGQLEPGVASPTAANGV
jgi:cytidylate kinase